mmetsp:Transcript_25264/g.41579  ORF Transcript_25264/g.41579 Transcript_25264/m.41579 type:complete len:383 (+) Transcript_25264:96-1244(+)
MASSSHTAVVKCPYNLNHPVSNEPIEPIPEHVLDQINSKDARRLALRYVHDPVSFRRRFAKGGGAEKRALRILVQMQTVNAIMRARYHLAPGIYCNIDPKLTPEIIFYASDHQYNFFSKSPPAATTTENACEISVIKGDCLETALWLRRTDPSCNPAVLVMASRSHPGGGFESGAGAQEENLCRRTNLWQALLSVQDQCYPIPEYGGIYTKNALVIRKGEESGYTFLPQPELISFFNVAAINSPSTEPCKTRPNERRLCKKMVGIYRKKIATMLNIALDQGHDTVVLSAFGCGAYGNPPRHMAEIFKEVLRSPRMDVGIDDDEKNNECGAGPPIAYVRMFRKIVFAIIDDHNAKSPGGNVRPFAEVFDQTPVDLGSVMGSAE